MTNENENENNNEYREVIEVHPKGVSTEITAFLLFIVLVLCTTSIYLGMHYHDSAACAANDANTKAQFDAQRATAEAMMQSQKRDSEIRLTLVKSCVDKGFIPVFQSGNIDCKLMPKGN